MNVEIHPSHLVERPEGGVPPVIDTPAALERSLGVLDAADGPIAIDTERASGFRYSDRACLVQLRRGDDPAQLVDPLAFDAQAMAELQAVIGGSEWVLHAATQDLPCLRELGLRPHTLFDTELGARLLNLPHVGLGGLLDDLMGVHLRKEHSAADWSRRPLPEDWLAYAALDVEYLVELRDLVERLLDEQGKLDLAREEFAAEVDFRPRVKDGEPWRRTSGLSHVRRPGQLRVVRELWRERDRIAHDRDLSPHRLLPDRALIAAATHPSRNARELLDVQGFDGRAAASELRHWWAAVQRGRASAEPIELHPRHTGIPPHRSWNRVNPDADRRLHAAREALGEIAAAHDLPLENLLPPRMLRQVAWEADDHPSEGHIRARLMELGARRWQVDLTAAAVHDAFEHAVEG